MEPLLAGEIKTGATIIRLTFSKITPVSKEDRLLRGGIGSRGTSWEVTVIVEVKNEEYFAAYYVLDILN